MITSKDLSGAAELPPGLKLSMAEPDASIFDGGDEPAPPPEKPELPEGTQRGHDETVVGALLGIPEYIGKMNIGAISLETIAKLIRVKSEFMSGVPLQEMADPILATGQFLYIQDDANDEEFPAIADDKAAFDRACYKVLKPIAPTDMQALGEAIVDAINRRTQTQTRLAEGQTVTGGPKP